MGAWVSSFWWGGYGSYDPNDISSNKYLKSVQENVRTLAGRASPRYKRERLGQANLRNAILASVFGRDVANLISAAVERETIKDLFADACECDDTTTVRMVRIDCIDRIKRKEIHVYVRPNELNDMKNMNDMKDMKDLIVVGSERSIGLAHPRHAWTRVDSHFTANMMATLDSISNRDGQVTVVEVTLDDIGYPLCSFEIARVNGIFRVSRVELMQQYVIGFDETERILVYDFCSLATLPMPKMPSCSVYAITLSLAYPVLKGLVGHPRVFFEPMWGSGLGARHAHHEFCHDTVLPMDDDNKAKIAFRKTIDATMGSVGVGGRVYVSMRPFV